MYIVNKWFSQWAQPQHSLKAGFLPRVFPIELSNSSLAKQALEVVA